MPFLHTITTNYHCKRRGTLPTEVSEGQVIGEDQTHDRQKLSDGLRSSRELLMVFGHSLVLSGSYEVRVVVDATVQGSLTEERNGRSLAGGLAKYLKPRDPAETELCLALNMLAGGRCFAKVGCTPIHIFGWFGMGMWGGQHSEHTES